VVLTETAEAEGELARALTLPRLAETQLCILPLPVTPLERLRQVQDLPAVERRETPSHGQALAAVDLGQPEVDAPSEGPHER
jgi:hypothetical protein